MIANRAWYCGLSSKQMPILAALAWMAISLSACSDPGLTSLVISPVPTSPAGYSAAHATLEAGQAQAIQLAIQSTQVALNLTQAAATEMHFAGQTAQAQQSTATALAQAATATQIAYLHHQTESAAAYQTQAAQATQTADAAHTATAWPQTATPLAATQLAIVAQAETAQRRAHWEQVLIPLQVITFGLLGFAILILLVLGGVNAYRRLLPALEMRLRTFRRGPNDAPLIFLDDLIIDPDRNFGPALWINPNGAQTTGLAPSPQLQERLVARDQAVDLARTQSPARSRASYPALEPFADIQPDILSDMEIEIIDPQKVKPWLDEVERKLLPAGYARKE